MASIALAAATHDEMKRATAALAETPAMVRLVTGPGGTRAAAAVKKLLAETRIDQLTFVGFAGGLDPELKVGDVVRPRRVMNEAGDAYELPNDAPPRGNASSAIPLLLSVARLVVSAREKRAWFERCGAACVDMESFAVAEVAAQHGVALRVIRAISDAADDALPAEALTWLTADGRTDVAAVSRYLATHPWKLPTLMKLKAGAEAAGQALAEALR